MSLQLRAYQADDYPHLAEWWQLWKWQVPPIELLSSTGLIVYDDQYPKGISAGWIYRTNSGWVLMECIVSDRRVQKDKRGKALALLIESLTHMARAMGGKVLWTSTDNKHMAKKLRDGKFIMANSGLQHFVVDLGMI